MLREHGGSMSASQLYDAVLEATGSKETAEAAHNARLKAQLKAGQRPEA